MPDEKYCRNCKGSKRQPFYEATENERKHLESLGKNPGGWWRCGNHGEPGRCLWIQPYFNQSAGLTLPDSFR